jgi:hypothetical protein
MDPNSNSVGAFLCTLKPSWMRGLQPGRQVQCAKHKTESAHGNKQDEFRIRKTPAFERRMTSTTENEMADDVTQLHDRITITLSAKLTKAVRIEAEGEGKTIEAFIEEGLWSHCEISDMSRNYDFVRVRKPGR